MASNNASNVLVEECSEYNRGVANWLFFQTRMSALIGYGSRRRVTTDDDRLSRFEMQLTLLVLVERRRPAKRYRTA
eukprot:scaffold141088_cov31-Prasinocladus_malaysianus.AAC.1